MKFPPPQKESNSSQFLLSRIPFKSVSRYLRIISKLVFRQPFYSRWFANLCRSPINTASKVINRLEDRSVLRRVNILAGGCISEHIHFEVV
jgi:hypothetical protein